MWLSQKIAEKAPQTEQICDGMITVSGTAPAVVTDEEARGVRLVSPGGYLWRPGVQDRVLVLKGPDCCVIGTVQEETDLDPGEIRIVTGKSSICLTADGEIRLTGEVYINGRRWVADAGGSTE